MSPAEAQLRLELLDYCHRLHQRGWVANHDGNLSCRLRAGQILCTPTATSKAEVRDDSLLVVDESGARLSGKGKPFSELTLHLAVLKARPDAKAVIHAHPPHATALGASGRCLDQPFLPEAVVSLGPLIPLVPLTAPGTASALALSPLLPFFDVVLMAGNGVLAWGDSVEQAYLRLELVEHLCRIVLLALPVGGVQPLPESLLRPLLDARKKAGLGPESRGLVLPESPVGAVRLGSTPSDRLYSLIRAEVAAALTKS
jgi:L-fuculose-phosphate aldolase